MDTRRADTLGEILSLELAVDDPQRRSILLGGIPEFKVEELERRVGMSIDELRQNGELEQPTRRALLGFLGLATVPQRVSVRANDAESVAPSRGLFPHQKRAAIAVERYLYYEDGRVMLHLPTGVGKTRTAMSIVATHLRTYRSGLIVWLAATRELLEQAADEFESTWKAVGDRSVDCLRFWSSYNAPIDKATNGIVIAGLAKCTLTAKYDSDYGNLATKQRWWCLMRHTRR